MVLMVSTVSWILLSKLWISFWEAVDRRKLFI